MILWNQDILRSLYDKTTIADTANKIRLSMQNSRATTRFLRDDHATTRGKRSKTKESISSNPSGPRASLLLSSDTRVGLIPLPTPIGLASHAGQTADQSLRGRA